jgi:peroxiredoxin
MYPHERSLVKEMGKTGKFVLLGINSDSTPAKVRAVVKREGLSWPMLFDGGGTDGPVSTKWGVRGWPTTYVLDAQGVIRARDVRDEEMTNAVEELVKEARAGKK